MAILNYSLRPIEQIAYREVSPGIWNLKLIGSIKIKPFALPRLRWHKHCPLIWRNNLRFAHRRFPPFSSRDVPNSHGTTLILPFFKKILGWLALVGTHF